ncbi:hypothetical protein [Thalassotalea sp. G2M2-11]|uniref:hypothetical protein n=1 Tax=Thalassotalea sp. G2M2-11 TaxID=2787627 RepID=UPI0019CFC93D|nr:hypothetical protein [Thalassotalea sp. G2M2-11]
MKFNKVVSLGILLSACIVAGCAIYPKTKSAATQNQFNIIAKGMMFDAPETVPAGWTKFHFSNDSDLVHFALIQKLPEGRQLADVRHEVVPPFQEGMNLIIAGQSEQAMQAFGKIPAWFQQVKPAGGPGLLSSGKQSSATVFLEPGHYYLECYVKTNGVFHPMQRAFTVTEEVATVAPKADIRLTISSARGIELDGEITAGKHIIEVTFEDQKIHENFVGHDVHLAKVNSNAASVIEWMNWASPTGLETPSPVEFIGGLEEMPAGGVGYFSVDIEPGNYLWISEVPDAKNKGLYLVTKVR